MQAALAVLAAWPGARRRIAVLGDMLELGARAPALHAAAGARIRDAELWTVGAHARDYAAGARQAGARARVFAAKAELAGALRAALRAGVVVLVKASHGAALEQVVAGLEEEA
jgi:UDP-N-acetylmuramoyl-tripeptide--D-alanyl-D-alanine ligase